MANLEAPTGADTTRISAVLARDGKIAAYSSFSQLSNHAHFGFAGSGTFDQIMDALEVLVAKTRDLQTDLARAKAALN